MLVRAGVWAIAGLCKALNKEVGMGGYLVFNGVEEFFSNTAVAASIFPATNLISN